MPSRRLAHVAGCAIGLALLAGCASATAGQPVASAPPTGPPTARAASPAPSSSTSPSPSPLAPPSAPSSAATAAPGWLGARVLPQRADGSVPPQTTPVELRDRRIATVDRLPPPAGGRYASAITPVPAAVAARSTWSAGCPVSLDRLRYVTVSFWGFDARPHTGELLVNAAAADDLVTVFADLYRARYPIEDMHITSPQEAAAPPTGDGNDTAAFACRPSRGQTNWSQHAYGLAIDVNPFQNPYVSGDVVLPELARAYLDRSWNRPGMIDGGGPVVRAFASIGWSWGGRWHDPKDIMHFSANGH